LIAALNYTDRSVGVIDLPHIGTEEDGNMWQKLRSIWGYVYDNYLDECNYFYIGGDDVLVAVDNLRSYLNGPEVVDEIAHIHGKVVVEMPLPLFFRI